MGIGVSVFLIAVGAILAFAVNVTASGIDLSTVGVILMLAGGLGLVASLFIFGGSGSGGRRTVVTDYDEPGASRRVTHREDIL